MDLPRDDLYRVTYPSMEVRASEDKKPVISGHFSVFDQWTEINSGFEGNFMERVAPGAFKRTINNGAKGMRFLFQHGRDPQVGDKPLGRITQLREDDQGAYYEVEPFDSVPDLIMDGLRAGVYGASFRFKVNQEDVNDDPGVSAWNPKGLPERTIQEASVSEFGPVTFGAYAGATAGVRSFTDTMRAAYDAEAVTRAAEILVDDERLASAREYILAMRSTEQPEGEGERGTYTEAEKKQMAKDGHAMPDGSYPIGDASDVSDAAALVGHSKTYSEAEVKAHIIKNAKRLGAESELPKSWNVGRSDDTLHDTTARPKDELAPRKRTSPTGTRSRLYPDHTAQQPAWLLKPQKDKE